MRSKYIFIPKRQRLSISEMIRKSLKTVGSVRRIMKIGFLGGGRMAYAMANGFIQQGITKGTDITASVHPLDKVCADAFESLGAKTVINNLPVVENSEVVIVSVKPGVVSTVLKEVSLSEASKNKLFISIAMGVSINYLEQHLPSEARVVRVMPNTPALVSQGASVYSPGSKATDADAQITRKLFEAVGTCDEVPEESMDAVTALSGSGPAYVYMMIEALADGGVFSGLPRDLAIKLATQTVLGSAVMVKETGTHSAILKDNVTSPAGSTASGTYFLEKNGFRASVIGAVKSAYDRCKEVSAILNK